MTSANKIIDVIEKDIRFPTSLEGDGADPMVVLFFYYDIQV